MKPAGPCRRFNTRISNVFADGWGGEPPGNAPLRQGGTVRASFAPTGTGSARTTHAARLFKPADGMTIGAGIACGRRGILTGTSDDAARVRISCQFTF